VNWLAKYDPDLHNHGSIADKYVASAYFTIIGLSTVGFGDISPANTTERMYSIVLTLLGAVVFAIVIGSVSEIAQQVAFSEWHITSTIYFVENDIYLYISNYTSLDH